MKKLPPRHAEQNAGLSYAVQDELLAEDDQVMQHHAADDADDHPDVELTDIADHLAAEVGFRQSVRMHLEADEFLVGPRMTLPAGLRQVGMIDGGARIAGGQNVMHPVTAGAIRHRR